MQMEINTSQEANSIRQVILASQYLFLKELKAAENFFVQNELDCSLHLAVKLSTYSYLNFTSYYASFRLEKLLQQIGERVIQPALHKPKPKSGRRRILHIASELYELGGHTPLLLKWIQRDTLSDHKLFLTRQSSENIPVKIFAKHGIDRSTICWSNKGESLVDTAQQLLNQTSDYDFIVMHTHPDDVVPILAFAKGKPIPIYFLNHADHCFWLGASVIDGLVQLRQTTIEPDKTQRGLLDVPQFVLPIPINEQPPAVLSRQDVRNKYQIAEKHRIVLLTTSTESKFNPLLDYNYFETVIPVLNQNPACLLLIVGIGNDKPLAIKYKHPQIKFLGYLFPEDLAEIENITNIYLETFPFSSFTALLQVLMKGKPVHFMFSPPSVFKLFSDDTFYTASIISWQEQLNKLIQQPEALEKYAKNLFQKVSAIYSTDAWHQALQNFYRYTDSNVKILPLRYKEDVSFSSTTNDLILYGISLKERYQFLFFEDKGNFILIKRIVSFLKIYVKKYSNRTKIFSIGLKEVSKKTLQLVK